MLWVGSDLKDYLVSSSKPIAIGCVLATLSMVWRRLKKQPPMSSNSFSYIPRTRVGFRSRDWDHDTEGLSSSTSACGEIHGTTFVSGFFATLGHKLTAAPGDGDDILGRGRAAVDLPILNAAL